MSIRSPKRSLVGGEIDPDLHDASDLEPARAGAATVKNFIVRDKGGIERTPGTEHIAAAKGADRVRLAGFVRSSSASYLAEYGPNYVRLRDVADMSQFEEVATPYAQDDLVYLQFAQSADIQWVFSGKPLKELQRLDDGGGGYTFQLVDALISNGPFMDLDYSETRTITPSATTGDITLTASADLFDAGHVGAFWRLQERDFSGVDKWGPGKAVSVNARIRYNGNVYRVSKAGTTSGIAPAHTEGIEKDGVGSSAVEFEYLHSGYGIVKITGFTSATVVSATVQTTLPDQIVSGGTAKWQEGSWSDYRGHPIAGALYKNALWAAASEAQPNVLWKSAIDGFDDFEPGTEDDRALSRGLFDGSTEAVRWLSPGASLAIGTDGPEWVARPEDAGDTVRVNNLFTEITTNIGASDIPGITVSGRLVFAETSRRRLMSIKYDLRREGWEPEDLSLLAAHLLGVGVLELVYQRNPWPIFWCLLEDGTLAGLTFLPDQNVLAWHRHDFGDPVESIAVLPVDSGRRETLFLAVRRNGQVNIERMFDRFRPEVGQKIEDARYLTAAKTYTQDPAQDTFAGLDHLEGRQVIALVDGRSHPPVTVTGGQVTLQFAGSNVVIGLPYQSRFKTLPFDMGLPDEDQRSRNKRISDLAIGFKSSLGGQVLMNDLPANVFELGATPLGSAPALFTGVRNVSPPGADDSGQLEYVNETAWPATILSIFPEYEV